jgi:hypothetical protein
MEQLKPGEGELLSPPIPKLEDGVDQPPCQTILQATILMHLMCLIQSVSF